MIDSDSDPRPRLPASVLREYDIRGVVSPDGLNPQVAEIVGYTFATMVGNESTICVGYDGRTTSVELEQSLIRGLTATGSTVERVGLVPTPMLYFATRERSAAAGVMVTGSHNPPEYNGFKLVVREGPFYGEAIQRLGTLANQIKIRPVESPAEPVSVDVTDEYLHRLLGQYDSPRPLRVAWDAGNGATGAVVEHLVRKLPGRHLLLYTTIDGRFPNHHPDPSVAENMTELAALVVSEQCDLGIGFDGDGDRIGVVDQYGRVLGGDQLLSIYAADLLSEHPGATVVTDIKSSQSLLDYIVQLGGEPILWQSGHARIRSKMEQTGALLAGEMSGHIFFADRWNGFDDALYGAVRLLGILGRSQQGLTTLCARLPKVVNTPELRFEVPAERKFAVIEEIKDRLNKTNNGDQVITIDGLRVVNSRGWWLIRASNTQEMLVARIESDTDANLVELKAVLAGLLLASGIQPPSELFP